MNIQKKFLLDLLPYDASTKVNGSLEKGIKEYSLLLEASARAVRAFECGDLEQFDALVGENACQIRAVKIAMMFQGKLGSLGSQVEEVKERVRELKVEGLMKSGISLQALIQNEGLEIVLTQDEFFLAEAFLLSLAKTVEDSKGLFRIEKTEAKKLQVLGEITSSFAGSLVKKVKQLISAASVEFVRSLRLEKMCSEEFTIKCGGCLCLPMFWTYKTLLLAAQEKGIPLVFIAKDAESLH